MKSNTDDNVDDNDTTNTNPNPATNLDERIQQKAAQLSSLNQSFTESNYSNSQIGNYSGINHDNSHPIHNSNNNSSATTNSHSRNVLLLNQTHRVSQHEKQQNQKRKLFTFHNNEGDFDGSTTVSPSFNSFSSSSSTSSCYHVMDESNFDSSATLNMELLLLKSKEEQKHNDNDDKHDDNDDCNDGESAILIQPVRNQLQIHCYLPPKSNNLTTAATTTHGTNTDMSSKDPFNSIFNQQRLFGSFMGNTGFMHQRGWSNTQLLIGYYLFYGKSLLVDWKTENGLSKMSYGISSSPSETTTSNQHRNTYYEMKIHYPSSSYMNIEEHDFKYNQREKRLSNDPMSSTTYDYQNYKDPYLSFQSSTDIIRKKLRVFFNLSKFVPYQLFDGTLPLYRFGLYTIHESEEDEGRQIPHVVWHVSKNTKERNLYDPFSMTVKYIQPHSTASIANSSSSSQMELSITTHGKFMSFLHHTQYTLHALLTRCISSTSNENELKLTTGIEIDSFKGLSWLFQWRKGDFSINVPVRLSSVLFGNTGSASGSSYHGLSLWKAISTSYVTFISYMIDCIIGDVIQQSINHVISNSTAPASVNNHINERSLTLQRKLRKDAEQQKELMRRKSMMNKRNEDEKDGLVIVNATYGLLEDIQKYNGNENKNDDDVGKVLDVGVQLQFWVNDSKLILTSNSKSQMIGFYDVTMGGSKSSSMKEGRNEAGSMGLVSLWKHLLQDDDFERQSPSALPYLMIRYRFNGVLYDIRIRDDEAATLPSPKAVITGSE